MSAHTVTSGEVELTAAAMRAALALAEQGRGRVEPNPMVGAIVLDAAGSIVGRGWHQRFGGPHAEIFALEEAGERARGGTLIVNLEPCSHQGKTGPCVERVIAAGIAKVVVAQRDPYPEVAGRGLEAMAKAGIAVEVGLCETEARELNAPYLTLVEKGRPFVHAKWAMSIDGRIATRTGDSKWITGPEAREHAHAFRGLVDAILVGAGTVAADDPELTARGADPARQPIRVILDPNFRTDAQAKLMTTSRTTPTLVVGGEWTPPENRARIDRLGCETWLAPANSTGGFDLAAMLAEFGRRRWTNLLVEGGSRTLGAFFDADLADAIRAYVAPMTIGGSNAPGPVGGIGVESVASAKDWKWMPPQALGNDLFFEAQRIPGPAADRP